MTDAPHKNLVALMRRYQDQVQYAALRTAAEANITEWRWARWPMLPGLPYENIVHGLKPDRWTVKPVKDGWLHGLDEQGRVLYARNTFERDETEYVCEKLGLHENSGFYLMTFDHLKRPVGTEWYEMNGRRFLHHWQLYGYGHGLAETIIHWEGDRFAGYELRSCSVDLDSAANAMVELDNDSFRSRRSYLYSADGELERVLMSFPGNPDIPSIVEYLGFPKGRNLKSLLAEVEELLVAEIPRKVTHVELQGAFCLLLMQYTGRDTNRAGFVPPIFAIPETLRADLETERPTDVPDLDILWFCPNLEGCLGVKRIDPVTEQIDEQLRWICQLTVVKPSRSIRKSVRKMFRRVCKRLNEFDWSGIIETTDDFVVLPFDPHGDRDLKTDLKMCLPSHRLRTLIERGYVRRMRIS